MTTNNADPAALAPRDLAIFVKSTPMPDVRALMSGDAGTPCCRRSFGGCRTCSGPIGRPVSTPSSTG